MASLPTNDQSLENNFPLVLDKTPSKFRRPLRLLDKLSIDFQHSQNTQPAISESIDEKKFYEQGWLYKWTNYFKGYQKRWFILSNGILSYYKNKEEMAHTCRGNIVLVGAYIETMSKLFFVVRSGTSQVFHLRAQTEAERQRWVTILELAKNHAIEHDEGDSEAYDDYNLPPSDSPFETQNNALYVLQSNYDALYMKGKQLLRVINTGDVLDNLSPVLKEKFTLYSISASTFMNAARDFFECSQQLFSKCQEENKSETVHREKLEKAMAELDDQMREMCKQIDDRRESTLDPLTQRCLTYEEDRDMLDVCVNSDNADAISINSQAGPITVLSSKGDTEITSETTDNSSEIKLLNGEMELDWPLNSIGSKKDEPPDYKTLSYSSDDEEFYDADCDDETIFRMKPECSIDSITLDSVSTGSYIHTSNHKPNFKDLAQMSIIESMTFNPCVVSNYANEDIINAGPYYQPGPEGLDRGLNTPLEPSANFRNCRKPRCTIQKRRETIPIKPIVKLSYWLILKNCIGKDLSKIPMPVHFNEPLSLLQRIIEELEYSRLLDESSSCNNSLEQMCFVVGFTVSAYSTTIDRVTKPFNPLLGETYECDRRAEFGWRSLTEQVSHHPPAFAMHAEHKDWVYWQDYTASSKFRGKYLTIIPQGVAHLVFYKSRNHYTWRKVTTTVHNIIVGRLWIDQYGEMEIINHTTKERCVLKYIPYSYFSRERYRKVTGSVYDSDNNERFVLRGYWDEYMEYAPLIVNEEGQSVPGQFKRCWTQFEHRHHTTMYNFTDFAITFNELEAGLAQTDSRLRPDQRLMEEGDFDEANKAKHVLEEKQRGKRRVREALAAKAADLERRDQHGKAQHYLEEANYSPVWFEKRFDPCTNTLVHTYKGGYWEAKETGTFDSLNLPDIF